MKSVAPPCICGYDGKLTSKACALHGAAPKLAAALQGLLDYCNGNVPYFGESRMDGKDEADAADAALTEWDAP